MQTPAQQTPPKPIIVILYGAGIQAPYELSGKHLLKIWDQWNNTENKMRATHPMEKRRPGDYAKSTSNNGGERRAS